MSIAWYALQPIGAVTDMLLAQRDIRDNKNNGLTLYRPHLATLAASPGLARR
jgi:hypothetical protein